MKQFITLSSLSSEAFALGARFPQRRRRINYLRSQAKDAILIDSLLVKKMDGL